MSLISELKNTVVCFEAKGSSVIFKNIFHCFGNDKDIVECPLAIAIDVDFATGAGGNYEEKWSKEEVAKLLADLLNKELGLL